MTGKPRNERRAAARARVGDPHRGGQASTGAKNSIVWVNAFRGAGITVELAPEDAEAFAWAVLEAVAEIRRKPGG